MNDKAIAGKLLVILLAFSLAGCIHIGDATDPQTFNFTQQPISTAILDPLAVLTGTPIPPQAGQFDITITNQSSWDICYLFIAPTTDSSWGKDLLAKDEKIAPGDSKTISVNGDTYDMRAENCDFMRLDEQYGINIASNYSWQANDPNEIFYEDFSGDTSRWIGPQTDTGKSDVADEALNLTGTKNSALALEQYPQTVQDSIMVVEATALQQNPGSQALGMMCRIQANGDGYLFLVRSDKQFSIQKVSEGKWTALDDWKPYPKADFYSDINILEVECYGTTLRLRFNGLTLSSVEDSTFDSGFFGLAAVPFGDTPAQFRFDNLAVIEP